MTKYEYQVVELEASFWTAQPSGLQAILAEKGSAGWKLAELLTPVRSGLSKFVIVFERPQL